MRSKCLGEPCLCADSPEPSLRSHLRQVPKAAEMRHPAVDYDRRSYVTNAPFHIVRRMLFRAFKTSAFMQMTRGHRYVNDQICPKVICLVKESYL